MDTLTIILLIIVGLVFLPQILTLLGIGLIAAIALIGTGLILAASPFIFIYHLFKKDNKPEKDILN